MKISRNELIEKHIDSFPVLPITVTRMMQVISKPDSSAKDVMEAILPDHSLCLTILKIANSVLFGRPKKVDSITLAVAILGFNEVQRIAMSKALINSFRKLSSQYKQVMDQFWQHSFMCGIAAKLIAKDLNINPDVAFTGGVIHDIGKLIMLQTFTDDYPLEYWMTKFSNENTLHDELKIFSFTHDMIGAQLLRKWYFPENLITAVAYHHRPEDATVEKKLAYVIQLADLLSFFCCRREELGDADIVAVMHENLPAVQEKWLKAGLDLANGSVVDWYSWLLLNHEQSNTMMDAFAPG